MVSGLVLSGALGGPETASGASGRQPLSVLSIHLLPETREMTTLQKARGLAVTLTRTPVGCGERWTRGRSSVKNSPR
jgi:hypothetical protein